MPDLSTLSALAFPLIAGITTFFAPCAYPLLPGYVGFYVSQTEGETPSLGGALGRGLIAGAGVVGTFALLFGGTFLVGNALLAHLTAIELLVGGLLIAFGLLVALERAPSLTVALPKRRSSALGFGVFGAGYALAAAGCLAPVFVAVVSYVLTLSTPMMLLATATYVGTVVTLMVSVTVATGMGLVAGGGWVAAHTRTIERLAGVVMILAGVGQLYVVFTQSAGL